MHADALSFCCDGSLFAVAHDNLISLWDPALSLKTTFVSPSPVQVIFSAFIEPRGSTSLKHSSTGEVFLVAGSKQSVSVYDLFTLKVVWSVTTDGEYSAFSVAQDDAHAMQNLCRSSSDTLGAQSLGSRAGWIAVCQSHLKSSLKVSTKDKNTTTPGKNKEILSKLVAGENSDDENIEAVSKITNGTWEYEVVL